MYEGCPLDCVGACVTPSNFLRVLQGEPPNMITSGKRIKSGPNDTILVFLAGHGVEDDRSVMFPNEDELYSKDLIEVLKSIGRV